MLKISNFEVLGWKHAIRGMRNPMNSWEKSDSGWGCSADFVDRRCVDCDRYDNEYEWGLCRYDKYIIGPNDLDLMKRLLNAGTDHRKFMRMITVYVDITAPLYWWKEFDTYKVGTVANSCSTMHKIHAREFTMEDFSYEHLTESPVGEGTIWNPYKHLCNTISCLNACREAYLQTEDKKYWWQMIQLLPSSYNQKRTVMMNYEVLANIYKSRKNHKLDEWAETKLVGEGHPDNMYPNKFSIGFCDWIKTLPYSELITGEFKED